MRTRTAIAFLLLVGCAAERADLAVAQSTRGLDEALAGMTAGQAQPCINRAQIRSLTVVDGGQGILVEKASRKMYLNRPNGQCRAGAGTYLRMRSTSGQVCNGDVAEVIGAGDVELGSCSLGAFTPYERR